MFIWENKICLNNEFGSVNKLSMLSSVQSHVPNIARIHVLYRLTYRSLNYKQICVRVFLCRAS